MSDVELEHAGKKGMKWGVRKAEPTASSGGSGATPKAPTLKKALLLGQFGKKSSYTNPEALASRKKAGSLRIAAISASAGATAIGMISSKSGNPSVVLGGAIVSQLVNAAAGGVSIASYGNAAKAIRTEQDSRD